MYVSGVLKGRIVYVNGSSKPQLCTLMGVFVYVSGSVAYMNGSESCTLMGVCVYKLHWFGTRQLCQVKFCEYTIKAIFAPETSHQGL